MQQENQQETRINNGGDSQMSKDTGDKQESDKSQHINKNAETMEDMIEENEMPQGEEEQGLEQSSVVDDQQRIEQLSQELEQFKAIALRSRADYDNLKRRNERQRIETKNWLIRDIATGILGALDDFERALQSIGSPESIEEKGQKFDGIVEGIELVLGKINDVLEGFGVEQTGKVGEDFDPNYHEALQMVDSPDSVGQKIGMVFQKGYKINEFSIRLAKVQVLKGGHDEDVNAEKSEEEDSG